jgi:hypothetical protein
MKFGLAPTMLMIFSGIKLEPKKTVRSLQPGESKQNYISQLARLAEDYKTAPEYIRGSEDRFVFKSIKNIGILDLWKT